MPEFFIISEHGARNVELHLDEMGALAEDMMPVLAEIALDMMRVEEAVFSSQGRRGGGSWKPLKPDTVRRKGSTEILQGGASWGYGDGPMDSLLHSLTIPGAAYQILDISNSGIIFGTERPWAFVHQHGSTYKNRPRRPFIQWTPNDVDRWSGMLARHLLRPFEVANVNE